MGEKTFATVMIILPSEFTDGNVLVSHGKETKDFDTSGVSLIETTVLAWHTGVNLELVGRKSSMPFSAHTGTESDHKRTSLCTTVQPRAHR
jgi:hypothetical protein